MRYFFMTIDQILNDATHNPFLTAKAKAQLYQVVAEIIGEDEPEIVKADMRRVMADNRVRRYGNYIKDKQRQAAREAFGFDNPSAEVQSEEDHVSS
jgi:hypothetical protein